MLPNAWANHPEAPLPTWPACPVQHCALGCSCPTWPGQGTCHPKFLYRKTGFMDLVEICCALWVVGEGGCLLFTLDGRGPGRVSAGRDPKGVSLQNLLCYWTKHRRRCGAQRAPGRRLNQSCAALVFMKHLNRLQAHNWSFSPVYWITTRWWVFKYTYAEGL